MSIRRNNRLGIIAVIVMIILLLINAYLLYNNFNQKKIIQQTQKEVKATNKLKADLEKEYYNALSELEELRGNNEELNEMIEEQKNLLKDQKVQISTLIEENKNLEYIRLQIDEMKENADKYLAEIKSLKEENEELEQSNTKLIQEKENLQDEMEVQRRKKDSLGNLSESIEQQKEIVEKKNKKLNKTIALAAAIQLVNIETKTYKIANDGDLKRRRRAKNVELIETCYETTANKVADVGTESFHIRIIDPDGSTMAIETKGSGVFTEMEGNTQLRFTQLTQMRYNKTPSVGCVQWRPEIDFIEGIYEVEIYNKGYLVGKTTFKLR